MPENYLSAGVHIRNIADFPFEVRILETHGKFRIVQLASPFVEGSEFWVVNEKGFLWEPVGSSEEAKKYLESTEAQDYQNG